MAEGPRQAKKKLKINEIIDEIKTEANISTDNVPEERIRAVQLEHNAHPREMETLLLAIRNSMQEVEDLDQNFRRENESLNSLQYIEKYNRDIAHAYDLRNKRFDYLIYNFSAVVCDLSRYSKCLDKLVEQENRRPDPLDTKNLWEAATRGPLFCAQYWYYKHPELINGRDPRLQLFSPLHLAVQKGHEDIAKFLLEKGAHVNMRSAQAGMTALLEACFRGKPSMVQILLDHGANALHVDGNKETCLHWAVRGGEIEVVDLMLANGVDHTCLNTLGWNAGDLALRLHYMDIYQRLNKCD